MHAIVHSATQKAETQDVILVARHCTEGVSRATHVMHTLCCLLNAFCAAAQQAARKQYAVVMSAHLRPVVEGVGSEPGLAVGE